MATGTKLSFRARALDANKAMCVYYSTELPDLSECAPIARAVAQMPTGMEKEEEMESHLQDAMLAQQASTSGVRVDNHVIPTPKVFPVDAGRYRRLYPSQPPPKNSYIKVQAWLSLDNEEPDYDIDSEDEQWLADRPNIDARTLERIFDSLEAQSSESNICLPTTARTVLTAFDESVVDDVYDYWIAKRTKATKFVRNFQSSVGGLIPRVRTDCRKEGQVINPYVAFRRRAEKMQTRKNRKNDEDSYEKVLKLSHDLRKAVTLFDMVKRREKTKQALIDLDADILSRRMFLADFGSTIFDQIMNKVRPDKIQSTAEPKTEEESFKKRVKKIHRARIRPLNAGVDREVPNKAWLKKNAEVWNRPPTSFNSIGVSPIVEVERFAQAASDANLDGRYAFKRRRGCLYREPLPSDSLVNYERFPVAQRICPVSLPDGNGNLRPACFVRRRIGRGGRVIYDRVIRQQEPRVPKVVYDPFDQDFLECSSTSFHVQPRSGDEPCFLSRTFPEDSKRELLWLHLEASNSKEQPPSLTCEESGSGPGNGLTGRVTHLNPPVQESGMESAPVVRTQDEWREGSGSPSESNSSAEWTPPSLGAGAAAFALLASEEEARTGDHPIVLHPAVKESMIGVSTVLECAAPFMLPAPSVGS